MDIKTTSPEFYRRFRRAQNYLNNEWALDDIKWWGIFHHWSERYWQAIGEKDPFKFRKWPKLAFKVYENDLTNMNLHKKVQSWALIDRLCGEPSFVRFTELVQEYANCMLENCKYCPFDEYMREEADNIVESFLDTVNDALKKFKLEPLVVKMVPAEGPHMCYIKKEYLVTTTMQDSNDILSQSEKHSINFCSDRSEKALRTIQSKHNILKRLIIKLKLSFLEVDAEVSPKP